MGVATPLSNKFSVIKVEEGKIITSQRIYTAILILLNSPSWNYENIYGKQCGEFNSRSKEKYQWHHLQILPKP